MVLSVLRDAHLAQDAAQDAFVKAYEKLGNLRRAEAFGPWLLMISRHCALDIASKHREAPLPDHDIVPETRPAGLLDEEKERLLAAVLKPHASERQVVMLRYFGGYSVKEIADIAGRNVGTVTYTIWATGTEQSQNLRTEAIQSSDYGTRMDTYLNGDLVGQSFTSMDDGVFVTLMPWKKLYTAVKLTDALCEEIRLSSGAAVEMDDDKIIKLKMAAAHIGGLEGQGKEPMYYGQTVTASDTGKVLLR